MKKVLILCLFLIPGISLLSQESGNFPEGYKPRAWVNDYADLFPANEEQYLNSKLGYYEDTTSTQILVVTLNRDMHENMPISLMGATIGEAWNIGQRGKDNGMILVIYPDEREVAIQTGYGLEQFVPDALAKRIIEQEIKPSFRAEQYGQGIDRATDVLFSLLSGEFTADEYRRSSGGNPAPFGFLIIIVFILLFLGQSRRKRSYGVGRSLPFWVALGMMGSSGNAHRGRYNNFSSGTGGFGGFGGGFGGGGGGSFGGGGASGGW